MMNNVRFSRRTMLAAAVFTPTVLTILPSMPGRAFAQNPQVQQRLAQLKQAAAANRAALSRYTWQELQAIIVNGEVKKQDLYQVRLGPDGKPVRTLLMNNQQSSQPTGPIRQHMIDKKIAEYQQYGNQIADLARQYAQPDPIRLQQCYQSGYVTLGSGGAPGVVQLKITSYVQPNDAVQIWFDPTHKALLSIQISSYLNSPSNAVQIAMQFDKLIDGTTHVSTMTVNGVSMGLVVKVTNGEYQKL